MGLDSMFYCVLRTMFWNVYVVLFRKVNGIPVWIIYTPFPVTFS